MRRTLCLWLPHLPLERLARKGDLRTDGPFAIIAEEKSAWRITHANRQAAESGVSPGQSLPDARAICPALLSEPADPVRERGMLVTLRRWADKLSPAIAIDEPDCLLLDIAGVTHLFGGEAEMACHAMEALFDLGLTARAGIADTRRAAQALAKYGRGPLEIAEEGLTITALRDLPVDALACPVSLIGDLKRAGLKTIGQLTEIRSADLSRRFGLEVSAARAALSGHEPDPVSLSNLAPTYAARMTVPEPIGLVSDLRAVLERLAEQVCKRLKDQSCGARRFGLTVRCVDTGDHHLHVGFARPCVEVHHILHQFHHPLDQLKISFGADWFRLWAEQVEPLCPRQMGLDYAGAETDGLSQIITTIGNRLGFDRVHRFLPRDAHVPERTFACAEAATSEPVEDWGPSSALRPISLCDPVQPVSLIEAGRPPLRFSWRGQEFTTHLAKGPERFTGEWWVAGETRTRDYWWIQTEEGLRLWLMTYPAAPEVRWYVAGVFA